MIYAIEAIGTGFIKFGKAKSVGKRLTELECACPHELHILAVADWPDGAETAVHLYLQPEHQRGEWFKDSPLVREVMAWMVNGIAGLERLQSEVSMAARRQILWGSTPETPLDKRRAERKAWWKARECQGSQQKAV